MCCSSSAMNRRMGQSFRLLFIGLSALLWAACGHVENEFSNERIFFVFDNSLHHNDALAEAMVPNSGIFCTIHQQMQGGVNQYVCHNTAGRTTATPLSAVDLQRTHMLGLNNGLIVGYGNLNDPPTFYAYDRECPNCFNPQTIPLRSRPLRLEAGGLATCDVCHRQYSLNNNGLIVQGEKGKKLTRYRANTTGPYGVLSVN